MRWENKGRFDCMLSQQHLCQKLSQSNHVCEELKIIASQRWDVFETQCSDCNYYRKVITVFARVRLLAKSKVSDFKLKVPPELAY